MGRKNSHHFYELYRSLCQKGFAGREFTVLEVSKALRRTRQAVNNNLLELITNGWVERQESPMWPRGKRNYYMLVDYPMDADSVEERIQEVLKSKGTLNFTECDPEHKVWLAHVESRKQLRLQRERLIKGGQL